MEAWLCHGNPAKKRPEASKDKAALRFRGSGLAVRTVLHTLVQDLAYVCAKLCMRLCKVLHAPVQHLCHPVSFFSVMGMT